MNTGNLITVQRDVNPNSPSYNTTRNVSTPDSVTCPGVTPDWQVVTTYCIVDSENKNTGQKTTVEMDMNPGSPTYHTSRDTTTTDTLTCPIPNTNPLWTLLNSECQTETLLGDIVNTGIRIDHQYDNNPFSETYNDTRDVLVSDAATCPPPNKNPKWTQISYACQPGNVPYATVTELDENKYSPTFNTTRTRTVYDGGCYIYIPPPTPPSNILITK